eukprot:365019-Chlamydomonas_euryale.AAC.1
MQLFAPAAPVLRATHQSAPLSCLPWAIEAVAAAAVAAAAAGAAGVLAVSAAAAAVCELHAPARRSTPATVPLLPAECSLRCQRLQTECQSPEPPQPQLAAMSAHTVPSCWLHALLRHLARPRPWPQRRLQARRPQRQQRPRKRRRPWVGRGRPRLRPPHDARPQAANARDRGGRPCHCRCRRGAAPVSARTAAAQVWRPHQRHVVRRQQRSKAATWQVAVANIDSSAVRSIARVHGCRRHARAGHVNVQCRCALCRAQQAIPGGSGSCRHGAARLARRGIDQPLLLCL